MHELTGISKAIKRPKVRLTEISQEPYPFLSFKKKYYLFLKYSKCFTKGLKKKIMHFLTIDFI